MDNKIAHLQFLQDVISRMARNSFMIKGWTMTLVSALFAFAVTDLNAHFILIALIPAVMFWFLDAFFLQQEKLFRELYSQVGNGKITSDDFTMNVMQVKKDGMEYLTVMFSKTLLAFHGTLIACIVGAIFLVC